MSDCPTVHTLHGPFTDETRMLYRMATSSKVESHAARRGQMAAWKRTRA